MIIIRGQFTLVEYGNTQVVIPTIDWRRILHDSIKSGYDPKGMAVSSAMRNVGWHSRK